MSSCKICGFDQRKVYDQQFDITFYHCPNCLFMSKDEGDFIGEQEELAIYESHNNSIEDDHYVQYFKRFLDRAVMPFVGPGKKALDFGSGPSPVLAEILQRDYAYEVDIYDLFYAPEKVYLGKTYDLITCTEVIEHVKDPLHYFGLLKSLLKPGRILGMMTLFHPEDDQAFLDWHYRRDMSHISFFTPRTMEVIAEKMDLEICFIDDRRYVSFRKRETL